MIFGVWWVGGLLLGAIDQIILFRGCLLKYKDVPLILCVSLTIIS